jgi:hypothetical protein
MWLDSQLFYRYPFGITLAEVARKWKVTTKQVRRELAAFRELGYAAAACVQGGTEELAWCYQAGQRPLFSKNLPRK